MTTGEMQRFAFGIIGHAGDAQSLCMEALQLAKAGDRAGCDALLERAAGQIRLAHGIQTEMLGLDDGQGVPLVVAHAQDHLMHAQLVETLVRELAELYGRL